MDLSKSAKGVAGQQASPQNCGASGNEEASHDMAACRQPAVTKCAKVTDAGNPGKNESISSVKVVAQVDDRSEAVAETADSDIIHVVNEKKCIDAGESIPENL